MVIWDVDGTMLDTSEGLISSTISMIEDFNLPMPEEEVIRSFVGPRIQDSVKRVYPELSDETRKEMAACFRKHYLDEDVLKATPYQGVKELMKGMKAAGIMQTVATNKGQVFTDNLMVKNGMTEYLLGVFGTDSAGKLNKSDLILKAVESGKEYGIKIQDAIMIGDSEYDAEGAAIAGVDFLAVTYGFGFKNEKDTENYKKVAIADSIEEIERLLM